MTIVVIADRELKEELCGGKDPASFAVIWAPSVAELPDFTEVIVDLLFQNSIEHKQALINSGANTIIINSVSDTLEKTDPSFIRINGWKTFLKGELIEASGGPGNRKIVEDVFSGFGKKIEWVSDKTGFITPRVISMIINEAFFALDEKVSTREEIDTAMKLGTNYPYGPFEWAEKIGLENIRDLLKKLSQENPRYQPAPGILPA
jgi:3-hydroxybutyryl-CoA dehydrogenase